MSYTPPAGDAAQFSWVGAAAYTPPAAGSASFTWEPAGAAGTGAGVLDFTGAGVARHGVAGVGMGVLDFAGAGVAEHGIVSVVGSGSGELGFAGAGVARHGVAGVGAGVLGFAGASAGAHGVAGTGSCALGFAGAGVAAHVRYEVRGEVRIGSVLVNRRVRCYKRSTGALTGQADTVAGVYRVHAGFDDAEVYVTAIDMAEAATDWIPPTANRLVPVLASDTA